MNELRAAALEALAIPDPDAKAVSIRTTFDRLARGEIEIDPHVTLRPLSTPGRPPRPLLVEPRDVPRRKLGAPNGRAALIHSLAHIEFNAINLALDAVTRFPGLPADFYRDWTRVAAEEALHFTLLAAHLRTLGSAYGEYPAHNGLWEMAQKTAVDPLARMGLVPRILEARGLDVTPAIQAKLRQAGDDTAVSILDVIYRDEVGHVAIGNRWFEYLCRARDVEPSVMFRQLLAEYDVPPPHPPFNEEARLRAGFGAEELASWMA